MAKNNINKSNLTKAINEHKDLYGDSDLVLKLDLENLENHIFNAGYLEGMREALRIIK
jgi:hypothetical protein|tara:strand:+ start:1515 stop:1688 length:174 start_codon:yes stop_codon:yes gene_type:complete